MKIAVPYENGQVFQNFGHSAQFKIQDTENGKLLSSEIVSTKQQTPHSETKSECGVHL